MITYSIRTAVVACSVWVGATSPAWAGTGDTLLDLKSQCISATAANQTRCSSFIEGVIRGYWATVATLKRHDIRLKFLCVPPSDTLDLQVSEAAVRKYIHRQPDDDRRPPESVIVEALRETYGCLEAVTPGL